MLFICTNVVAVSVVDGVATMLFHPSHACHVNQVERLSGLIARPTEDMDQDLRLTIINSSNNVEQRTLHLYTIIENDLLGQLQCSNNYIAPYKVRAHIENNMMRWQNTYNNSTATGHVHPAAQPCISVAEHASNRGAGRGRRQGGPCVGTCAV